MQQYLHAKIVDFFSRNMFERLVCYIFIAELAVRVVFELIQGQWFYIQSQNRQYIFYALIMMDYVMTFPRILTIGVRMNYVAMFLLLFLVMIMQGVFVGVINHNPPFEIFNDTVPLLVLVLNALRMQSVSEESRPIDFHRLFVFCTYISVATCLAGLLALSLGYQSRASVGTESGGIYYPMFFAALLTYKRVSPKLILMFLVIVVLSGLNMNRTTMAFLGMMAMFYAGYMLLKRPAQGMLAIASMLVLVAIGWSMLPEESGTYQRIMAMGDLDFKASSGSLGERANEVRSIQRKLSDEGATAELFGGGHGALYDVQFTHEFLRDHGHAHYAWALFNLRYGMSGYIYLSLLALMLLYHACRNVDMRNPTALMIAFMCVQSLLYMGTYVNFIFLMAGAQFLYLAKPQKQREGKWAAC